MTDQRTNLVHVIDSGMPAPSDVSWLATGRAYRASVVVASGAGRQPVTYVPVLLVVLRHRVGINAGGDEYIDGGGGGWQADQRYADGSARW